MIGGIVGGIFGTICLIVICCVFKEKIKYYLTCRCFCNTKSSARKIEFQGEKKEAVLE
jgi:hypothetical protein